MSDVIKTRDLMKVLRQLGFSEVRGKKGSHALMLHERTGLLVTIPTERDEIPQVYLTSVRSQLRNYNIVSDERFQKMLSASRHAIGKSLQT